MPLQSIDLDAPRNGGTAQSALLRRIDLTTLRLFIAVCEEKNLRGRLQHLRGLDVAAACLGKRRGGHASGQQEILRCQTMKARVFQINDIVRVSHNEDVAAKLKTVILDQIENRRGR
jgi:hypothetical protein